MKPIELLVQAINAHVKDGEIIFALSAPITVPVKREDNTYRQTPLTGDEEFFFKGVRAGAGDKLVFEFTPVDAKPYQQAEFSEKIVFSTFGDPMHKILLDALGMGVDVPWEKARATYMRRATKEQEQKKAAEKEAVVEAERKSNEDNPLWGMF